MKRLFVLLSIIVFFFFHAYGQVPASMYVIADSSANFTRPLPARSFVLSLQSNELFILTAPANTATSLASAAKSQVSSGGGVVEETDPVWTSEKGDYATTIQLGDSVSQLRSEFPELSVDSSALWSQNDTAVLLVSDKKIIEINGQYSYHFIDTTSTGSYEQLDSIGFSASCANIELIATAVSTSSQANYNYQISVINGVLNFNWTAQNKNGNNWHITCYLNGDYIVFKARSDVQVIWDYNVNIKSN